MWATHQHLHTHRGSAMPTLSSLQNAAAMAGLHLSRGVHINSGASVTTWTLSCTRSLQPEQHSSLFGLSVHPASVLSPGLSAEAQVFSTSPHTLQEIRILGCRMQQGGHDQVCWSLFCLLQANCCTHLWVSEAPCPGSSLSWWRGCPGWGNLSSFTAPSKGWRFC